MALKDLCQQYGIRFKKALGQNLLLDENIHRIMADAAGLEASDDVLEVGAGLGALTAVLAQRAGRVLSVEIDSAFMPCLEDRFGDIEAVRLFRGDILNHEVKKLLDEFLPGCTAYKVVANLPYYITTPLLFHFWESAQEADAPRLLRMVVMVQEEVALRMVAPAGGRDYGALSIASRYYGEVDIVHKVARTCFRPMPRVDSCIVRVRMHQQRAFSPQEGAFVLRVVRAAFAHRRKTLRNCLTRTGDFGAPKEAVLEAFDAVGIDPQRRPQTLSIEEFQNLAHAIWTRLPG